MPELSVRNHDIFYDVGGVGEPVVLLHGGGSSGRQWKAIASELESQFTCYAPDLFGHGKTSNWASEDGPLLEDYGTIVDAIAALVGEPFHLVGHSHGGAVAITYAIRNPETLSSLTLIEPTLMHLLRVCENSAWREANDLGSRHIEAVRRGELAEIADEFLPYWIGQEAWQSMPDDRRATIIEAMPAVAQFWSSQFAEATPAQAYAELDVPTLLIRGTKTRATAHAIINLLCDLLPSARLIEIEEAGHMAPLTHDSAVNEAIALHVKLHSRSS